jgi:short-subunit dehydrogenase
MTANELSKQRASGRRTALVTGAGTGIGAAIAQRLAAQGMNLVVVARDLARLESRAQQLRAEHSIEVLTVPLDLSRPDAPVHLAKQLGDAGVEVDILVNNAGVALVGSVAESDAGTMRALIDLNAAAVAELTALFLPAMVARGRGAIVNIASTAAYAPAPYNAAYAASKAFVLSFTQALWRETQGTGVRVVAVSPGPVQTPMNPAPFPECGSPSRPRTPSWPLCAAAAPQWSTAASSRSRPSCSAVSSPPGWLPGSPESSSARRPENAELRALAWSDDAASIYSHAQSRHSGSGGTLESSGSSIGFTSTLYSGFHSFSAATNLAITSGDAVYTSAGCFGPPKSTRTTRRGNSLIGIHLSLVAAVVDNPEPGLIPIAAAPGLGATVDATGAEVARNRILRNIASHWPALGASATDDEGTSRYSPESEAIMELERLGGDSTDGQSPTLFVSDKGTYVAQGWRTDRPDTIEIPQRLIRHLRPGTCFGALLHDTGHGTFTLTGQPVTDTDALSQMRLPDHEFAVEVPIGAERRRDAAPRVR